jgi:hypothetical protein
MAELPMYKLYMDAALNCRFFLGFSLLHFLVFLEKYDLINTILSEAVKNNLYIQPITDDFGNSIIGYFMNNR